MRINLPVAATRTLTTASPVQMLFPFGHLRPRYSTVPQYLVIIDGSARFFTSIATGRDIPAASWAEPGLHCPVTSGLPPFEEIPALVPRYRVQTHATYCRNGGVGTYIYHELLCCRSWFRLLINHRRRNTSILARSLKSHRSNKPTVRLQNWVRRLRNSYSEIVSSS